MGMGSVIYTIQHTHTQTIQANTILPANTIQRQNTVFFFQKHHHGLPKKPEPQDSQPKKLQAKPVATSQQNPKTTGNFSNKVVEPRRTLLQSNKIRFKKRNLNPMLKFYFKNCSSTATLLQTYL